ncbi:MAG: recombinase XerD [Verrucomicrobia bacterium A1]|nr:MAG: recombinase XerD [Verrucomicrobia bacterium A1]
MPRKGQRKLRIRDLGDPDGSAFLAAAFCDALRQKNYSPATIRGREHYLGVFVRWCAERGLFQPREITKPILERYQRWLYHYRQKNGNPLTFRSQATHLIPVRAFFKWLTRENHILYNPASEIELPKLEHRLPKHVLTAHEAESVIALPDVREPMGLRDRAILEVFYSTGMRRMELANLKLYDLDNERGTVMIRQGKGKKDRMIPIGERALAWVGKYLADARPRLVQEPDDGTIFVTNLGEAFSPNRLTQLAREYVKAAELGKTGACHLFRHTMATLMLENGADIRFIQEMLGHAELSTTQIYTQVSIRKLKEIHTATHPAKMKPDRPDVSAVVLAEAETFDNPA